MHNEKIHIDSTGKFYKVLFDNPVGTGVGTAVITKDYYCVGIGVMLLHMVLPDSLYVVADKSYDYKLNSERLKSKKQ